MTPPNDKQEQFEVKKKIFASICNEHYLGIELTETEEQDLINLCEEYYNKKIEQQAPAKTLDQCKQEIAERGEFQSFKSLIYWCRMMPKSVDEYYNQAAELYANQFKR
ncbi:MAG: hypothetical protein V4687_15975 [Bacteroidota bacterium]